MASMGVVVVVKLKSAGGIWSEERQTIVVVEARPGLYP